MFLSLLLLLGAAPPAGPPNTAAQIVSGRGLIGKDIATYERSDYPCEAVVPVSGGDLRSVEVYRFNGRVDAVLGVLSKPLASLDNLGDLAAQLGSLGVEPFGPDLYLYRYQMQGCFSAPVLERLRATTDPTLYALHEGGAVTGLLRVHKKTWSDRSGITSTSGARGWGDGQYLQILDDAQIGAAFRRGDRPTDVYFRLFDVLAHGPLDAPGARAAFLEVQEVRAELLAEADARRRAEVADAEVEIKRHLEKSEALLREDDLPGLQDEVSRVWLYSSWRAPQLGEPLRVRLAEHHDAVRARLESLLEEATTREVTLAAWWLRDLMGATTTAEALARQAEIERRKAAERLFADEGPEVQLGPFEGEATLTWRRLTTGVPYTFTGYRDNTEAAARWQAELEAVDSELAELAWVPRGPVGGTTYVSGESDFAGQLYDPGESAARKATQASHGQAARIEALQRQITDLEYERGQLYKFREHDRKFGTWTETVDVPMECQKWVVSGARTAWVDLPAERVEVRTSVFHAIQAEEVGLCRRSAAPELGVAAMDKTIDRERAIALALQATEDSTSWAQRLQWEWSRRVREAELDAKGASPALRAVARAANSHYLDSFDVYFSQITHPDGWSALMAERGGSGAEAPPTTLAETLPDVVREHMRLASLTPLYVWLCHSSLGRDVFPDACPPGGIHGDLPEHWKGSAPRRVGGQSIDIVGLAYCIETQGRARHAWLEENCPEHAEDPLPRWLSAVEGAGDAAPSR